MYDVIVVGYGPVGMVCACLLGRAGYRVAVLERHPERYPLSRVGGFHDDVARVFQDLGIMEDLLPDALIPRSYDFVSGGKVVYESKYSPDLGHGWPQYITLFQPYLERQLDRLAKSFSSVDVFQSEGLIALEQGRGQVTVETRSTATGARRKVAARFLIGADGGNSFVRQSLEIESEFLGFEHDWLVVDAAIKRSRPDWPELRQICDPKQPTSVVQMGAHHRRWAFMVFPDESLDEAIATENVWRRLQFREGATPDEVDLIRHVGYRFTSLLAKQWRLDHVILAGDSAHQMPPYLGQGLCSGIRDAYDISWKLDLVLRGISPDALLDAYEAEREPNVRAAIVESVRVGRTVIEQDPEKVRARDQHLLVLQEAQQTRQLGGYRIPPLTNGVIARPNVSGAAGAGEVFVQAKVGLQGREGLFDDVVGRGWLILSRKGDVNAILSDEWRDFWRRLGGKIFAIAPAPQAAAVVRDTTGAYMELMERQQCDVIVKRPDFYIFGMGQRAEDLPRLLRDLREQLECARS